MSTPEPTPAPKPGRPITHPCGTVAAYKRHKRHGATPCEPCRQAYNEAQRVMYAKRQANRLTP